jgi:AAHS family 4-hydroxybenzoate transporter-like MFS transporter
VKVAIDAFLDEHSGSWLQVTVVVLMTAVTVLDGLDMQLLPLAAPLILSEWGISRLALSPAIGGALMGMACGTVLGGRIGDRCGRRRTLVGAVCFFGVATSASAAVHSTGELTALRIISGVGFGASFPSLTALMAEWMPRRRMSQALGIVFVGFPAGITLGGTLAINILPLWGWRGTFVCGGLLAVILSLILLRVLPESPSWLAKRGNHAESIRRLLKHAWPAETFPPDIEFVASNSTAIAYVGSAKILQAENLRVNLGLWVAFFMNMFAGYALSSWSPVVLTALGVPIEDAVAASIYYGAASIAGALGAGWVSARLGTRPTMLWLASAAALVALIIATAAFLDLPLLRGAITWVIVGIALMGGCLSGLQPLLWVLAAQAYSTECRATGVAIAGGTGRVGAIASSLGTGALLHYTSEAYFFACITLSFALLAFGTIVLDRHLPAGVRA